MAAKQAIYESYAETRENLQMIAGTPDHVIPRLKKVMSVLRPGIFTFWLDGPVAAKDRMECLRLLATEVVPALREHGRALGLVDPFERKPGSRSLSASGAPDPSACSGCAAILRWKYPIWKRAARRSHGWPTRTAGPMLAPPCAMTH